MAHARQHWPGKKQRALKIILSLCSLVTCASSVSGLYPCIVCFFSSPHSSNAVLSLRMRKKGAIASYSLETQKNCQAFYHIIGQETQEKCEVFYHIVAQETQVKCKAFYHIVA
jgi:hypothetical protein